MSVLIEGRLVMSVRMTVGMLAAVLALPVPVQAQSEDGSAAEGPLAEDVYKNIQVLQGVPADQIRPTMQLISSSLGVRCGHCHVSNAQERDDKPEKQIARKMIRMVLSNNREYFDGERELSCFTCHRGNRRPVGTPIPSDMGRRSRSPSNVDRSELPDPVALLDKYIEATGGASAVAAISSRTATGSVESAASNPFPVEVYRKGKDKGLVITRMVGNDTSVGVNGDGGWTSSPGRGTRDMTAGATQAALLEDDLYLLQNVKQHYTRWRHGSPEDVNGAQTYVLNGSSSGRTPVRLYLDQQSGLLLRLMHFAETPLGRLPTQIDYSDYRVVDGIQVPFRIFSIRPDTRGTLLLETVEHNTPIDNSKFVKPDVM
jgi:photosynthetic reaction center cytochrome c subunit